MNSLRIACISILFLLQSACQPSPSASILPLNHVTQIVGGSQALPPTYPFVVNIWLNSPQDFFVGHLCGASLIHSKWVLTAAHCVLQDAAEPALGIVKLSDVRLYIGSIHADGKGGRLLKPLRIQVHPQYEFPTFDIALIELTEPVLDIAPVQLSTSINQTEILSRPATVVGWGLMDEMGKTESPVLREVSLNLLSTEMCSQDAYVQKRKWKLGTETVCAKTDFGKNASCDGDSGGPLFQSVNEGWIQVGVVSWGSACNPAFQNHQSDVEGYSSVAAAYPWIQSLVGF